MSSGQRSPRNSTESARPGRHAATSRRRRRAVRQTVVALRRTGLAAGLAASHGVPAFAQVQAPSQQHYEIAAGALAPALRALASTAGAPITFTAVQTSGKTTAGLHGEYGIDQAFATLLSGTGLAAVRRENGGYVLTPATQGDVRSDARALEPVHVTAGADATKTEGTGSYTTGATAAATGLPLALRDTPQSVSVVTQQQIRDQDLQTLAQALRNVTGVAVTTWDSERSFFNSRGFAVDNIQYDGVPTSLRNSYYGETHNDPIIYDRIEVVRGATGLLTGAGYPSASINLVRKRADSKTLAGSASLGLGTWNRRRATVDLSTPLSSDGGVRARVVAMAQSKNSQLDMYHSNKQVFYGVVEADLSPRTTLNVGFDYQRNRPTSVTWGGLPLVFSDGTYAEWDKSKTMATPWTYWSMTNQTAFANLEHRFENGWKAKLNLAHRKSEYDARLLYLSGNMNRLTGQGLTPLANYTTDFFQQNSLDAQATGPFTLLGRRHEWVIGFNFSQSRDVQISHAAATPLQSTGNFYAWDGSYAEPSWRAGAIASVDRTRQVGAYSALRLSLTDRLRFILGARQTDWRNETLTATRSHSAFTPYAGAIYDLNEVYSVYASYTDIFLPQNYRDVSGNYLSPVTGTNYEIGIKGEHLNGRLNTSFSLFKIEQDNVATRDGSNIVPGTTSFAYIGAKGVTSKGFEAQVAGEPLPGWNVVAGLSRTMAAQASGTPYNPDIPTTQFRLFTTWRLPNTWHALTVGGGFNWQNRTYTTIATSLAGNVVYEQKPVGVAELMARYEFTPKISLQINFNNIFNRKYLVYLSGQGTYGEGRNAMATLTYKL
ncbi:TonB-dependent siderophore receptor [Chitinasiproducens palmae]|nr:TonB-dependent receptor [Chitinasiproducens palmae]